MKYISKGSPSYKIFLDLWLRSTGRRQHGVVVYKFRLCQALQLSYVCLDWNEMWPLKVFQSPSWGKKESLPSRDVGTLHSYYFQWFQMKLLTPKPHFIYILLRTNIRRAELYVFQLLIERVLPSFWSSFLTSSSPSICNSLARAAGCPGWVDGGI